MLSQSVLSGTPSRAFDHPRHSVPTVPTAQSAARPPNIPTMSSSSSSVSSSSHSYSTTTSGFVSDMSLRVPSSSSDVTDTQPCAAPTLSAISLPTGPCPLLFLPDALYSRVLHFLSAEHKLNELSHLCRHLTPLSPVAFHHSHLQLDVANIASRPLNMLVPPAALGVHSLVLDLAAHQTQTAEASALVTQIAPPSPTAASHFYSLRVLSILLHGHHSTGNDSFLSRMLDDTTNYNSLLSTLIPSSSALPYLERLTVRNGGGMMHARNHDERVQCSVSLSALAHLPHLQHLTLCLPLGTDDYTDIFTLSNICTISLCSQQLHGELNMPHSVLTALPTLLSPSCRTLRLPRLNNELSDTQQPTQLPSSEQMMELVRQHAAERASGLQYLVVAGGPRDHALLLASAFPSLTALRVDAMCYQHDAELVLPALADLPVLQHISIAVGARPDKAVWEQFLGRAGPRLRTVHLRELYRLEVHEVNEWISMLLQYCTGLESLELALPLRLEYDHVGSNSKFTPHRLRVELSSLASLHTLGLWRLQLNDEQVRAILQSCPLLEDCTIKTPTTTAAVLEVLGRCCPLLRRVWLEGQGAELLGEAAADSLLPCVHSSDMEQTVPCSEWFRHLRVLHIDWMIAEHSASAKLAAMFARAGFGPEPPISTTARCPRFRISPRLTALLPRLLAAAPLRYLHLPLEYGVSVDAKQLLQWASKQQLRALDLPPTAHRLCRFYFNCTQSNPYVSQPHVAVSAGAESGADGEWWEAASDHGMASESRMVKAWKRVFKDASGSTGGRDGRAEMCAALQREVELDDG